MPGSSLKLSALHLRHQLLCHSVILIIPHCSLCGYSTPASSSSGSLVITSTCSGMLLQARPSCWRAFHISAIRDRRAISSRAVWILTGRTAESPRCQIQLRKHFYTGVDWKVHVHHGAKLCIEMQYIAFGGGGATITYKSSNTNHCQPYN